MTERNQPSSVQSTSFFDDHGHDSVPILPLSSQLVLLDNLIDPDVAHNITRDEDEVRLDESLRVKLSHGISHRARVRRHDSRNRQTRV